jgi:hypothetical protein
VRGSHTLAPMAPPDMFDDADPELARVRELAVALPNAAEKVSHGRPAYLGPSGWIGIDLGRGTDWTEVAELIDASYWLTAPKRNVEQLDGRD